MEEKTIDKIGEQPNSCEISVNAKGLWSGKLKVYSETIEGALVTAVLKAKELSVICKEQNDGVSK